MIHAPLLAETTLINQNVGTSYTMGFISSSGGTGGFFSSGGGGVSSCVNSSVWCIIQTALDLINRGFVPLLFAVSFLSFIYGVAQAYIFSHGDTTRTQKGHTFILWGIVGFAVMLSVWGLVNVLANTLGLSGAGAPTIPTSTSNFSVPVDINSTKNP